MQSSRGSSEDTRTNTKRKKDSSSRPPCPALKSSVNQSINHLPRIVHGSAATEHMDIGPCGVCSWFSICGHRRVGCALAGPWISSGSRGDAVHCLPWHMVREAGKGVWNASCTPPSSCTECGRDVASCWGNVMIWLQNCNSYNANGRVGTLCIWKVFFSRSENDRGRNHLFAYRGV